VGGSATIPLVGYIEELRAVVGPRPLITAGVVVVVLRGNTVLLDMRRDSRKWGLPGGLKELGESMEKAAQRELLEETGLLAKRVRLLALCSGPEFAHTYPNGDRIDQVAALYQALEVEGDPSAGEQESLEVRYFAVDRLPSPMEPLSERLLALALETLGGDGEESQGAGDAHCPRR
jgi:ADP-ribose pyrophosphatase YjhB (NUDIX family)